MTTITKLLQLACRIISPNALFANQWYCEETWLHIILALFPKITSLGIAEECWRGASTGDGGATLFADLGGCVV